MKSNPFVRRVNMRRRKPVAERFRISPTSSRCPDPDEHPVTCCGTPCVWLIHPRTGEAELVCSTCEPVRRKGGA